MKKSTEINIITPDNFINILCGDWRFELFRNEAADPFLTGTRSFRNLHKGHPSLVWHEEFDGRNIKVGGLLGFDNINNRFYEMGVPTEGPVEYWLGFFNADDISIEFFEPSSNKEAPHGTMTLVNQNEFTYTNEMFTAVFNRQGNP